jgi:hypothetical protein
MRPLLLAVYAVAAALALVAALWLPALLVAGGVTARWSLARRPSPERASRVR